MPLHRFCIIQKRSRARRGRRGRGSPGQKLQEAQPRARLLGQPGFLPRQTSRLEQGRAKGGGAGQPGSTAASGLLAIVPAGASAPRAKPPRTAPSLSGAARGPPRGISEPRASLVPAGRSAAGSLQGHLETQERWGRMRPLG